MLLAILIARQSEGLTVLSGPSFTPATNAPLAGVLNLTTDVGSQVSVSVSDGFGTWKRDFFDYGTDHSLILLGFKPDRTNEITVSVRDKYRNEVTAPELVSFITGPLPSELPAFAVLTDNTAQMEPGYMLLKPGYPTSGPGYVTIVDNSGSVVWYSALDTTVEERQLTDGNLFFSEVHEPAFAEANMLGEIVNTWTVPAGYPVDLHEDLMTDHGTILYLSDYDYSISNFPSSGSDPLAAEVTTNVVFDNVVEFSATNGALLNVWSIADIVDPLRIDYLAYVNSAFGVDPEHGNAIIEDPSDDSLIVSLRDQDAVIKFTRAGQLKWILGPHENWGPEWQPFLLTPVGTPFEWNYAQHAPILTPQGTLLLYDDGNERAEPFAAPVADQDNYSRAVEFSIDETNMQVSQVWEYADTNTDRLYTGALGDALWLPKTGNVLVDFGFVSYENGVPVDPISPYATIVHIKEVTHQANPSVVFDLKLSFPNNTNATFGGAYVYRVHALPDLYAHLPTPVANLTVQSQAPHALLKFTADPLRSYAIQASGDLKNWTTIGTALPDDADGDFSYQDAIDDSRPAQFYRVLTQ